MKPQPLFRTALSLLAFGMLAAPTLAQETAKEIVAKVNARLQNVKTYQKIGQIDFTSGAKRTGSMTVETQAAGNKYRMEGTFEAADRDKPSDDLFGKILLISDGKKAKIAFLTPKEYHVKEFPLPKYMKDHVSFAELTESDYNLLPLALLDDKPAYVLETVNKIPHGTMTTTFYVDKATYRVKQIRSTMSGVEGEVMHVTVTYKSEKIDEPIPDSLFKFIPPKGAIARKDGSQIAQNPDAMLMFGMLMGGQIR